MSPWVIAGGAALGGLSAYQQGKDYREVDLPATARYNRYGFLSGQYKGIPARPPSIFQGALGGMGAGVGQAQKMDESSATQATNDAYQKMLQAQTAQAEAATAQSKMGVVETPSGPQVVPIQPASPAAPVSNVDPAYRRGKLGLYAQATQGGYGRA